jgi:UPF0716 protein FxsA
MLLNLLILFTVVPLIELALLIKLGEVIHFWPTIGLILLTGVIGAALARYEGLRTVRQIQDELNQGRMPGKQLVDALMILVAGALLVTPGILTDGVGFSLLLPPVRALLRKWLEARFRASFTIHTDINMTPNDDFIDVEAHPVDNDENDSDPPLISR